eukprot:4896994-Amphidinium_carterae.1
MGGQLHDEGFAVPFKRQLAEATFSGNALLAIGGATPYQALLGRQPAILPDISIDAHDLPNHPVDPVRSQHRVREIAVQSMVEHTAPHTRPSGEQQQLQLGQEVDFWRQDATTAGREISSWKSGGLFAPPPPKTSIFTIDLDLTDDVVHTSCCEQIHSLCKEKRMIK